MAEGEAAEGTELGSDRPCPHPRPSLRTRAGGRGSGQTARVRGGVGGSQPAPPGASESRFCSRRGRPGSPAGCAAWVPALHQIPLANLIGGPAPTQLWVPAPLQPQPCSPGNCISAGSWVEIFSRNYDSPKSEGKKIKSERVFLKRHKLGLQSHKVCNKWLLVSSLPRPWTAKTEM